MNDKGRYRQRPGRPAAFRRALAGAKGISRQVIAIMRRFRVTIFKRPDLAEKHFLRERGYTATERHNFPQADLWDFGFVTATSFKKLFGSKLPTKIASVLLLIVYTRQYRNRHVLLMPLFGLPLHDHRPTAQHGRENLPFTPNLVKPYTAVLRQFIQWCIYWPHPPIRRASLSVREVSYSPISADLPLNCL